jgi:hypothetical protein
MQLLLDLFKLKSCYTVSMHDSQHIWQDWARILHRWGVQDIVASLLEAFGPLSLLGAQVVYLGQPILGRLGANDHLEELAHMLENRADTQAFVNFLREETLN